MIWIITKFYLWFLPFSTATPTATRWIQWNVNNSAHYSLLQNSESVQIMFLCLLWPVLCWCVCVCECVFSFIFVYSQNTCLVGKGKTKWNHSLDEARFLWIPYRSTLLGSLKICISKQSSEHNLNFEWKESESLGTSSEQNGVWKKGFFHNKFHKIFTIEKKTLNPLSYECARNYFIKFSLDERQEKMGKKDLQQTTVV